MAAAQLDRIDLHLKNINLLINVYVDVQTDRHPFNGLFFQDSLVKPTPGRLNQSGF